jgi:predicted solute-binding protein
MATTSKTLYRNAASTTTTTLLYTAPASTTTVITNIAVTNTSASSQTFTLALGGVTTPITIHAATTIAANTTVYIDCKQVLATTERITGGASATSVNFHIAGVEIS